MSRMATLATKLVWRPHGVHKYGDRFVSAVAMNAFKHNSTAAGRLWPTRAVLGRQGCSKSKYFYKANSFFNLTTRFQLLLNTLLNKIDVEYNSV